MGAWGSEAFANDDAMDWIGDLDSVTDLSVLYASFEPILTGDDFVEAPTGSVALAAAEVVAALRGRQHVDLPEEVVAWVTAFGPFDDDALVAAARAAANIVADDSRRSELHQIWAEAAEDDGRAWRQSVADLRSRLA